MNARMYYEYIHVVYRGEKRGDNHDWKNVQIYFLIFHFSMEAKLISEISLQFSLKNILNSFPAFSCVCCCFSFLPPLVSRPTLPGAACPGLNVRPLRAARSPAPRIWPHAALPGPTPAARQPSWSGPPWKTAVGPRPSHVDGGGCRRGADGDRQVWVTCRTDTPSVVFSDSPLAVYPSERR